MTKPTVLILTAGENSRFFPLNTDTHKGNLEIHGEPLIVRTLRNLEHHEFEEVVIVVSEKDYGGKGVSELLQHHDFKMKIHFVLQAQPNGMGDAVLHAREYVHGDRFAVISNYQAEAGTVLTEMSKVSDASVVCVTETNEPWNYGIVKITDGLLQEIVEKPERGTEPSNLKIQSIYLLTSNFLNILSNAGAGEYTFESSLTELAHKEKVHVHKASMSLLTLKYPWHLFEFQKYFFSKSHSSIHPDAKIAPTALIDDSHGAVIIEAGAQVGHAAKVVGPCFIGQGALVGDFSFVRGSSIERHAVVGANTEVVRSILLPHASVHFGYMADSILGYDTKIAAGLITANKRHDREHVKVMIKDQKVDTGTNALGICVGNHTKLGVRVTTMPGIMIGANATVFPSLTLFKNVEHSAVVKG